MRTEPSNGGRSRKSTTLWAVYLSALALYAWAYCYFGAIFILEVNTDRTTRPQADFIDAVYRSTSLDGGNERASILGDFTRAFPRYTDGIVDPLFPWLMRGWAGAPPDAVFEAGKWLNFLLAGGLLAAFAVAAARAFSFSGAAAIVLMGGFGVILERSGYFSSDALYFLLVVLTWLCALSLIRQNPLWLYGVFGVLLGLSYLAKPLVWPIVAGFVLVSLLRSLWSGLRPRRARDREEEPELWSASNQIVGLAMTAAAFLLVTGPRLSYASATFGDPFHTYLKYFVWFDSPSEAAAFQQTHPGRAELSAIPPDERPGLRRYLREKGAGALMERGFSGALAQVKSSVLGRGGWILVYGFVVFAAVATVHRIAATHQDDEVWRVRGTSARWMLLFLGMVGGITLFYTGVGHPVIPHNVMTTSLFLPILVTFIWISERYRRQLQRTRYALLVNRLHGALMAGAILWITVRIVLSVRTPVA